MRKKFHSAYGIIANAALSKILLKQRHVRLHSGDAKRDKLKIEVGPGDFGENMEVSLLKIKHAL